MNGKRSRKKGICATPDEAAPQQVAHAFAGMWKDREDMKDLVAYIRNMRKPRYTWDDRLGVVRTER